MNESDKYITRREFNEGISRAQKAIQAYELHISSPMTAHSASAMLNRALAELRPCRDRGELFGLKIRYNDALPDNVAFLVNEHDRIIGTIVNLASDIHDSVD